jgi:hypothetical protein
MYLQMLVVLMLRQGSEIHFCLCLKLDHGKQGIWKSPPLHIMLQWFETMVSNHMHLEGICLIYYVAHVCNGGVLKPWEFTTSETLC